MSPEIDRNRRVSELLKRELSDLIFSEISDPRVGSVTVTDVDISKDFKNATVLVNQLGGDRHSGEFVDALNHASKFIRHKLSQRTELRTTPKLQFKYDEASRMVLLCHS